MSVDSVAFSFLTDEEVHKHSFVKITSARLLDTLDKPVPSGLYDPAMGPLGDEPYVSETHLFIDIALNAQFC